MENMISRKSSFQGSERGDLENSGGQQEEESRKIPSWKEQITVRGILASLVIGSIYSFIGTKLNLTTGMIPNLNVSVALVAYWSVGSWVKLIEKAGLVSAPFTAQENTIMQTCAVACYNLSYGGGFGSYLLGLNRRTYLQAGGADTPGNTSQTKEPGFGWMTGFLFVSSFVGLFALVPLTKFLIINPRLTFPTGTATAVLINGFHNRLGDKQAKEQVSGFKKTGIASFLWAMFGWFYSGGVRCGFSQFPTFGIQAWKQSFYFDFSMTYVGAGMICSHRVNVSLLLGAILSWGIMWPLLRELKGKWYPGNIPESSLQSLNGYKVFILIALILGDGLYNFVKTVSITLFNIFTVKKPNLRTPSNDEKAMHDELFVRDTLPLWVASTGYVICSIVAIIAVPLIFPELKWHYVVIAYIMAPVLSFCNAYGTGLTDMNMAYNYGKAALFIFGAMAGKENGVVAGLIACGLIKTILNVSSDLMQDFKTGHLTLTSPKSMFICQFIGNAVGCVVAPSIFYMFYTTFDVGNPDGEYKAPYAIIYRNMAILVVEGFSVLPRHCLQLCYGFFAFAICANLLRDLFPKSIGKFMPLPMAMAVPFLVGANFAIDMFVGTLIKFAWHRLDDKKATLMVPAIASGLICGDGLWILPSSVLAMFKVHPPICMNFLPSE